jgi:preprotein translocase subunit YajC
MFYLVFFGFFITLSSGLFADNEPPLPPQRGQDFTQTMIMFGIAIAFFYFILWRPEQKRRKEMDDSRASLKKGDRVTAMGIIGTVSRVQEHTVVLRMVDGAKIEFLQSAITDIQGSESGNGDESDKRVSINKNG